MRKNNMETVVTGFYTSDQNYTTVYGDDNVIYTIARNGGDWGCVAVGNMTANNCILRQEDFDRWRSECTKRGTFHLEVN